MSILHSGVVNKSLVVVSCTALLWLSIEMTTGLNDTDLIQAESLNAHQKVTETEAKLAARNFTQGQTPASAEELTPEQMKRLIAKLGAQSFAEREAAANRLLQIGEPATPFLRGAISKSKDRTIQHLAKQTLDSIRDQSSNEMRKAFVSGEAQATLPGWKPYREIVGDTPWSRAFFICMYDNHRQLLEAYESDAMQASQLLARLCDEREHDTNAAEPTLLASALLVGQDKKVPISLGTQALLKLILRHSSVSLNEVTLDNSHKVLRALAAALFNQSREVVLENGSPWPLSKSHVTLYDMEQLGLQPEIGIMVVNDLRAFEGQIAPNRDKLNRKAAPNADILIGEWIYALGRFGDQSHLAVLEPWLKHSELTGLGSGQLVETRNVALAAMVHLSGQNGFEYGFSERFDDKPPLDPASRSRASCSLVDGKDFETALAQWRDWSEKHAPKAAVPPQ